MQIKTTMNYLLNCVIMLINKDRQQGLANMSEREHQWIVKGNINCAATLENSMRIPQKIKNRTTMESSHSTPEYLAEENENNNYKRCIQAFLLYDITYNSQDIQANLICINRQINIADIVCTMEYYQP